MADETPKHLLLKHGLTHPVSGATTPDLLQAELAVVYKKGEEGLYVKNDADEIVPIGGKEDVFVGSESGGTEEPSVILIDEDGNLPKIYTADEIDDKLALLEANGDSTVWVMGSNGKPSSIELTDNSSAAEGSRVSVYSQKEVDDHINTAIDGIEHPTEVTYIPSGQTTEKEAFIQIDENQEVVVELYSQSEIDSKLDATKQEVLDAVDEKLANLPSDSYDKSEVDAKVESVANQVKVKTSGSTTTKQSSIVVTSNSINDTDLPIYTTAQTNTQIDGKISAFETNKYNNTKTIRCTSFNSTSGTPNNKFDSQILIDESQPSVIVYTSSDVDSMIADVNTRIDNLSVGGDDIVEVRNANDTQGYIVLPSDYTSTKQQPVEVCPIDKYHTLKSTVVGIDDKYGKEVVTLSTALDTKIQVHYYGGTMDGSKTDPSAIIIDEFPSSDELTEVEVYTKVETNELVNDKVQVQSGTTTETSNILIDEASNANVEVYTKAEVDSLLAALKAQLKSQLGFNY